MDYLVHYGVKGMKWGVRHDNRTPEQKAIGAAEDAAEYKHNKSGEHGAKGLARAVKSVVGNAHVEAKTSDTRKLTSAQKRTSKEAEKDAKEFARAKMYYGEGAGNRRKLIKNQVESKKKKDPFYAEEFERHLANQDMNEHAIEARRERGRNDNAKANKKALKEAGKLLSRYGGNLL